MLLRFILRRIKKVAKPLKFWFKTAIYYYTPGGYGFYRTIKKYKDPNCVPNDASGTRHLYMNHDIFSTENSYSKGGFQYRNYDNYEEYVAHQKSKFDIVLKMGNSFRNSSVVVYRYLFYKQFCHLDNYLTKSSHILCAGARQGTEVEVLHDLGFKNAYGIDLNPGPNNKLVRVGDFMNLENPDSSLDMIYCNALDHAFNLEDLFKEHARVIKPDGYVLYDICTKGAYEFEAVGWKSAEQVIILLLQYFNAIIKVGTEKGVKWILLQGKK